MEPKPGILAYTVLVIEDNAIQYEQAYYIRDFPLARDRALTNARKMQKLWPNATVRIQVDVQADNPEQLAALLGEANLEEYGTRTGEKT